MLSGFSVAALLFASRAIQAPETDLARVFVKGEKYKYEFRSVVKTEERGRGLSTWIPDEQDIGYDFTFEVLEVKNDGIAVVHYLRPTMTFETEATADAPAKSKVEKVDLNMKATVSPYFELLDIIDQNADKKKKKKPGESSKDGLLRSRIATAEAHRQGLESFLGQFVQEVIQIAACVGPLDSSLDFAPKTPFEPVKVGETWKRTVGFSPQKLGNGKDKIVMQRLDYEYTFRGPMKSDGKDVLRVDAKLKVNSNLADYVHQISGLKPSQTNLKAAPLSFDGTLEFDLDPKTRQTLAIRGESNGGFSIVANDFPEPLIELKFKGRPTLRFVSKTMVTATPTSPTKPVKPSKKKPSQR